MRKRHQPEFAELMIVNPIRPGSETILLGDDGTLYQIEGFGPVKELPLEGWLLIGHDGTLYRLRGFRGTGRVQLVNVSKAGLGGELDGFGRFFLGTDGTLYELPQ